MKSRCTACAPKDCWPKRGGSLKFKLIDRNAHHPFPPLGLFVIDRWRRIE
jgi:hypothetical protein